MQILITNPFFPPYAPGGAEYSLQQMCERFADAGWVVRVVTNCYDGHPRLEKYFGYEVDWVDCPIRLLAGQRIDASAYTASREYSERLSHTLIKAAKTMGPNTILLANNAQSYLGTVKAARCLSIPVAGIVRDTQAICESGACIDNQSANIAKPCMNPWQMARCVLRFRRQRGVGGWRPVPGVLAQGFLIGLRREQLRRKGLLMLDQVITISDALKKLITKVPHLDSAKIVTIRNFHTNSAITPRAEVDRFLSSIGLARGQFFLVAGRKTMGKGVDIAVDAAHLLGGKRSVNVLFLGREKLWMPIKSNVIDHESVSQSLLLGVLQATVALIIPGRWQEGLHRTMIDAIFAGIPVICTDTGAPPIDGVADGHTGYVVPCENSIALASAMVRILDWTLEKREACRIASINRFKSHFATENLMRQWAEVFSKLEEIKEKKTNY